MLFEFYRSIQSSAKADGEKFGRPPPTPGTIKRVGALRSESHVAGHNRETLDVHIQLMLPLYNVLLIEKHSQTKIHLLSSVDFYQIYFIH